MPYKYFQESALGGRVDARDNADEHNLINELRQIVEDLANLLGHDLLDGLYPKSGPTGGTLSNVSKCNFSATAYPGVNDDETQGYSKGSVWIYSLVGKAYILVNAGTGVAVWRLITTGEDIFILEAGMTISMITEITGVLSIGA